mgnify:CR=1 FL=1
MSEPKNRRILITTIVILSILLLACIKIGPNEPVVTPVPPTNTPLPPTATPVPPTPTPPPQAQPQIVGVRLCRGLTEDGRPFAETSTFSEIDTFAISIQVANLKPDNVVSARWYQEDTLIGLTERDNITGNAYVGLTLEPQGRWTPGDYSVQVDLDGQVAETQRFAVIAAARLSKTSPNDGELGGNMLTFRSDTLGFSIDYPRNWLIDEGDTSVQFSHPQDTAAVLVTVNAKPQSTARQEAEMLFERILNSLPNVEQQDAGEQDNGWYGILFKYNKNGTDITGLLFSTVSGSRGYSVIFLVVQKDWDAIVPTLDKMWASFTIGEEATADEVVIAGVVVDVDTQQGIPNAYFVILKEGVTVEQYLDSGNDKTLIHAVAQTDRRGNFVTNVGVRRGATYDVFAVAKGYKPVVDQMTVPEDAADEWTVTVGMQKE